MPGRFARRLTPLALALVALPLAGLAQAQLLAEVLTVTAISAQFDPSVSLPRGSLRATGASEYAGLGCPLGLPRCDMRITRAARSLR